MAQNRLLVLDISAVLDMDTVSPVARMRNSYEKRFLERFERAAAKEQPEQSFLSNAFRFIAERTESIKRPELLHGAGTFLRKMTLLESYAGERVWRHAVGPSATEVRGKEYKHSYFSPYFAAFRGTGSTTEHFTYAALSNYGLDKSPKTDEEIDKHIKLSAIDDSTKREDVMIVTADADRAAKSRALGYQVVQIKNGDYEEALRHIAAFFPAPRPEGAKPTPQL